LQDEGVADEDVLVGRRIVLRRPRIDDADAIFAATASDPKVTEYLAWTPHPDVGETRRVITEVFNVGHDRTWAVTMRDTAEIIGQIGYRRPRPHEARLGYCIARRWWGEGLMPEAVGAILEHLQKDSRLDRVTAAVHPANTQSTRVLVKCGFTLEATLRRYIVLPNLSPVPQDCLLYARSLR
jgi:RimJ/RimL family protein N-acetyltransferase